MKNLNLNVNVNVEENAICEENVFDGVKKIIRDEKRKQEEEETVWKDSHFEEINDLKIDRSGRVGEKLVDMIFKGTPYIYESLGDANTDAEDGTYDMKIGKDIFSIKRTEAKLARMGKNNNFQHEHLKNTDECDIYLLIDFEPNWFHISILVKDIDFDEYRGKTGKKHPIFEKKFTKRKGEVNYKFDFSTRTLKNGLLNGYSIKVDENTSMVDVRNFILNFI